MSAKYKIQVVLLQIAVATITLVSCTKQLKQDPITDKELGNFLKNEREVEEYVIAAYAGLQANGTYRLYTPAMGEVPSDNTYEEVPANDGAIYGDMDEFKTVPVNDIMESNWFDSYKAIQKANVVLSRIADVPYASEAVKNSRTGEMKFIRALLYFNLVRFYGDVPLVTTETTDPNFYFGKGRTPAAQVYEQILKDLTEAITVLPENAAQQGRVIKTAAQALLGKVYLTQKNYALAKTQLDGVINSKKHALQAAVANIFALNNENNSEIIFSVQFASGINGNTEGSNMFEQFSPSGTVANAKGHSLPTKELYNLYSMNDARRGVYVALTNAGIPYNNKLKKPANIPDGASDFVVLRYADVLLMQAEVENELGNTVAAAALLDEVRARAGIAKTTATTQNDLRNAIGLERRLELVGEGHRWLDLLRTGKAISTMNAWFAAQGIPTVVTEKYLLFPVPQSQINTDPAITQNQGYR